MDIDEANKQNRAQLKTEIFRTIQESEDKNLKAVLVLLYGSLEYTDSVMQRIETKIDNLRHDEVALKKVVLNGYNDKHHEHHQWLDHTISNQQFYIDFITKATPILEWAEQHRKYYEENIKPICAWGKNSMDREADLQKDKKSLIMKFLGGMVNQLGTALAVLITAWFMWGPK